MQGIHRRDRLARLCVTSIIGSGSGSSRGISSSGSSSSCGGKAAHSARTAATTWLHLCRECLGACTVYACPTPGCRRMAHVHVLIPAATQAQSSVAVYPRCGCKHPQAPRSHSHLPPVEGGGQASEVVLGAPIIIINSSSTAKSGREGGRREAGLEPHPQRR